MKFKLIPQETLQAIIEDYMQCPGSEDFPPDGDNLDYDQRMFLLTGILNPQSREQQEALLEFLGDMEPTTLHNILASGLENIELADVLWLEWETLIHEELEKGWEGYLNREGMV